MQLTSDDDGGSRFEWLPDAADSLAQREASLFANEDSLEREGKFREHCRNEGFKDALHKAVQIVFWVVVVCLIIIILAYVWHLVAPECWHWMSPEMREKIGTGLLAALTSGAATRYYDRRMS